MEDGGLGEASEWCRWCPAVRAWVVHGRWRQFQPMAELQPGAAPVCGPAGVGGPGAGVVPAAALELARLTHGRYPGRMSAHGSTGVLAATDG